MQEYTEDPSAAKLRAELTKLAETLAASRSADESERGKSLGRALAGEILGDATSNDIAACCEVLAHHYPETPAVGELAELFQAALAANGLDAGTFTTCLQEARRARYAQPSPAACRDVVSKVPTLAIIADGAYYLRRPKEAHYTWLLKTHEALDIELARQFGFENQTIVTHDSKGNALPIREWLRAYASNAHRIERNFASAHITFDDSTNSLKIGYRLPEVVPHYDPQVETWLRELAGGGSEDLDALCECIAATAQKWIHKPAAAIALLGKKSVGKGLLALCLAKLWGQSAPISLATATERFNGRLADCPIWFADERMPKGTTSEAFRRMVQATERDVEHKGKEKIKLFGCSRIVIAVNELSDLELGDTNGPDAVEAISDRLALFDSKANWKSTLSALEALKRDDDGMADVERICAHLRWVQVEHEVRAQVRFLGTRLLSDFADRAVLKSVAAKAPAVFDALREYVLAPASWEGAYHTDRRTYPTGDRLPVVTDAGRFLAHFGELAERLKLRELDVRHALNSFQASAARVQPKFRGGYQPSLHELDIEKLALVWDLDAAEFHTVVNTVAGNTKQRHPTLAP